MTARPRHRRVTLDSGAKSPVQLRSQFESWPYCVPDTDPNTDSKIHASSSAPALRAGPVTPDTDYTEALKELTQDMTHRKVLPLFSGSPGWKKTALLGVGLAFDLYCLTGGVATMIKNQHLLQSLQYCESGLRQANNMWARSSMNTRVEATRLQQMRSQAALQSFDRLCYMSNLLVNDGTSDTLEHHASCSESDESELGRDFLQELDTISRYMGYKHACSDRWNEEV